MAKTIAFLVLLFVSVFPAAHAVNYTVGNSSGWSTNVNYTTWVSSLNFVVGDALVFNYGPGHSVYEVNAADYNSCNAAATPVSSYTLSPTAIPINATGNRYFICPSAGHCRIGQRLAISVTPGTTAAPPTGSAPPPGGGSVPSTPADTPPTAASSPGTPPSTPSPPSASSTLAGGQIMFSLVLAAMVVLMG